MDELGNPVEHKSKRLPPPHLLAVVNLWLLGFRQKPSLETLFAGAALVIDCGNPTQERLRLAELAVIQEPFGTLDGQCCDQTTSDPVGNRAIGREHAPRRNVAPCRIRLSTLRWQLGGFDTVPCHESFTNTKARGGAEVRINQDGEQKNVQYFGGLGRRGGG